MEEGVPALSDLQKPPPPQQHNHHHHHQQPPLPPPPKQASFPIATSQGTYIVQVPKTQIYRVPPLENALIVERHLNPEHHLKNPRSSSSLFWFFVIITIVVVLLGICAAIIYFSTNNPKSPTIVVSKVIVQNQNSHDRLSNPPQYHITLRSENPNEGMGIVYLDGGSAKLSYKQQEIAAGNPPAWSQDSKETKHFRLDLTGLDIVLPHQIIKSMKASKPSKKVSVSLSLSMNVPVKMKIAFIKLWTKNMAITCDFRVSLLAKNIHVLSQECHTKL